MIVPRMVEKVAEETKNSTSMEWKVIKKKKYLVLLLCIFTFILIKVFSFQWTGLLPTRTVIANINYFQDIIIKQNPRLVDKAHVWAIMKYAKWSVQWESNY